jgi:hypothetical protein
MLSGFLDDKTIKLPNSLKVDIPFKTKPSFFVRGIRVIQLLAFDSRF